MTPAALETLLTSQGFSSAAIAQAITHTLTDGFIPVEQSSDSRGVTVPDMPITDGKLTDQIRVLDVQDNIGVVDTDSFPNLNDIVYGVGNSSGTLEVSGVRAVKIYTADANTPSQDALNIDLTKSTGNVDVFMGNHGSDSVLGGAGADHVTTGTGLSEWTVSPRLTFSTLPRRSPMRSSPTRMPQPRW
jgi:hypothetical protein